MNETLNQQPDVIPQRLLEIERSIQELQDRNRRVESDKAWEISFARRSLLAMLTYFTTASVLWSLSVAAPLASAMIPVCGYVISTLTVPWAKNIWFAKRR